MNKTKLLLATAVASLVFGVQGAMGTCEGGLTCPESDRHTQCKGRQSGCGTIDKIDGGGDPSSCMSSDNYKKRGTLKDGIGMGSWCGWDQSITPGMGGKTCGQCLKITCGGPGTASPNTCKSQYVVAVNGNTAIANQFMDLWDYRGIYKKLGSPNANGNCGKNKNSCQWEAVDDSFCYNKQS